MSKKGENIYKRKDGRWEARYIRGYSPEKKILYGYAYGKKYSEAKEAMLRAVSELPKLPEKSETIFAEHCEEFMLRKKNHLKSSTLSKYAESLQKHILPAFGKEKLTSITPSRVCSFAARLSESGLSEKSVTDLLSFLRQLLRFSYFSEGLSAPDFRVTMPRTVKKEPRVLSSEEQKRLSLYLERQNDRVSAGTLLALYTGLRIGEICALQEKDVRLSERVIVVRKTVSRVHLPKTADGLPSTELTFSSPKTASSERFVPLTEKAESVARSLLTGDGEAFLLTGERGRCLEPRLMQYRFSKVTDACGFPDVHFHTLRHTFATRCVEVGFEIKTLSEILGHSNPRVTLERYVHSSMPMKFENMKKLSSVGM